VRLSGKKSWGHGIVGNSCPLGGGGGAAVFPFKKEKERSTPTRISCVEEADGNGGGSKKCQAPGGNSRGENLKCSTQTVPEKKG